MSANLLDLESLWGKGSTSFITGDDDHNHDDDYDNDIDDYGLAAARQAMKIQDKSDSRHHQLPTVASELQRHRRSSQVDVRGGGGAAAAASLQRESSSYGNAAAAATATAAERENRYRLIDFDWSVRMVVVSNNKDGGTAEPSPLVNNSPQQILLLKLKLQEISMHHRNHHHQRYNSSSSTTATTTVTNDKNDIVSEGGGGGGGGRRTGRLGSNDELMVPRAHNTSFNSISSSSSGSGRIVTRTLELSKEQVSHLLADMNQIEQTCLQLVQQMDNHSTMEEGGGGAGVGGIDDEHEDDGEGRSGGLTRVRTGRRADIMI